MTQVSCVYVIGPEPLGPGGLVKIGTSTQIQSRLKTFQMGSPVRLAVFWAVPGDASLEHWLHEAFAEDRRYGEWFDLGPDPVRAVQEALGPWGLNALESQVGAGFPMRVDYRSVEDVEDVEEAPEPDSLSISEAFGLGQSAGTGITTGEARRRLMDRLKELTDAGRTSLTYDDLADIPGEVDRSSGWVYEQLKLLTGAGVLKARKPIEGKTIYSIV